VEAAVTGKLLTGPRIGWDVTLSLWGNRNRLLQLHGPPVWPQAVGGDLAQRPVPGYPVGGYWTWPIPSYVDANGDGIITGSEVRLGPEPVWAGTPYPTPGAALTSQWTPGSRFRAARHGGRAPGARRYDHSRRSRSRDVDRLLGWRPRGRELRHHRARTATDHRGLRHTPSAAHLDAAPPTRLLT